MEQLEQRIQALLNLGELLGNYKLGNPSDSTLEKAVEAALANNRWFTEASICLMFEAWATALTKAKLQQWLAPYALPHSQPKTVALILAGNIPMVGFHDVVSVWVSGHQAVVKNSAKDPFLIPWMTHYLEAQTGVPQFRYVKEKITDFDAVIATGSNNSGRYFEYYFRDFPRIIRKNRNGIAVLFGHETQEELLGLGRDILQYFGLGCRNVSKIYIPKDYDLNRVFGGLYPHAAVMENNKYANNYDYNKAVWLMSEFDFLENGFFMIKEDTSFAAPIACLYYEYYDTIDQIKTMLQRDNEQIQCLVSHLRLPNALPFGTAQSPQLWEYADDVDTLKFLLEKI